MLVLASENQGAGSNGDAQMLQTRSCDQACEQDQARVQNMTRDQIRLGSDSVQQQDGSAESVQNRFGLTKGNGQNILTSFADQIGAQFRHAMGLVHTHWDSEPPPTVFFSPNLITGYLWTHFPIDTE